MKRKILILAVLAICIATLAAGTLAFFTAEGKAHNVITTGGVEISLREWSDGDRTHPFEDMEGIMPGMTVTKIAEVVNTGAAEAWVRVLITKDILIEGDGETDPGLIKLDLNTEFWTQGEDGYLYYKNRLAPGAVTEPIFTSVYFDYTMGNEYQNATASVDVEAQAVQTANNGASAAEAKGWPNP